MRTHSYKRSVVLFLYKTIAILLVTLCFAAAWKIAYESNIVNPFYAKGNWLVMGFFPVLFLIVARVYGGFCVSTSRISELAYSLVISLLLCNFLMYAVICLLARRLISPAAMAFSCAAEIVLCSVWSVGANKLYYRLYPPRRTVILYQNEDAYDTVKPVYRFDDKFLVTNAIRLFGAVDDAILDRLADAEVVLICGLSSVDRNAVLKYCLMHGISAYIRPKIGDILLSGAHRIQMFNVPFLHCHRSAPSLGYLAAKRTADILCSLAALLLFSPFMLATALIIRLYDGGPALYRQYRLTKNGRTFEIYKFRSMRMDAERDGVARLASEKDDRITPVGRVIRAIRFDELPQLFNVLKGDMSLVGPRPERPEIAAQYEQEMPEFALRLQAKAGLTGYAQVYGKYNTQPYDKLQMDLMYIANQSVVEDVRLMLVTVKIIFMAESTEGVSEGQTTAQTARDIKKSGARRGSKTKKGDGTK